MNFQEIEGWLTPEEGNALSLHAKNRRCVEIGSYKGKSANYIASVADSLICIDTFSADDGGQTQENNITTFDAFRANTKLYDNIIPVVGSSFDVHRILVENHFEFLFIDGMHDYLSVKKDLLNFVPKLKAGSVIVFHDYDEAWQGVIDCVDEFFGTPDELHGSAAVIFLTEERKKLFVNG